ncbi:MAG: hypothetical protein KC503_19365 [Myxococcales bacterium]|nr:hypothetical protein [Myxococcales bacterium]
MRIRKLFGVLVLGGASLGLACGDDAGGKPTTDTTGGRADVVLVQKDKGIADTVAKDSSVVVDAKPAADAPPTPGGDGSLDSASEDAQNGGFCPNDVACENGKLKKGFYCCWSTSC